MTKRYSIAEARANLTTLVDEVAAGNQVELTRRGRPVAVVVSQQVYSRMRAMRPRFVDAYDAFCDRYGLDEIGTNGDVFDNVRGSEPGRKVAL